MPQTMLLGRLTDMRTAGRHALCLTNFKGDNTEFALMQSLRVYQ